MDNFTPQIIPFFAQPHVHSVIQDNTFYDETTAVPTSDVLPFSTVVVTGADKGIDNTFVRLTSKDIKQRIFGKGDFKKYGQASLQTDELFNGSTNVWFCRVLPDNATYANMILVAHYRKGKILDDKNQETGKHRLEVKYTLEHAKPPTVKDGAKDDIDINAMCESLVKDQPDSLTGYMSVPLLYIRSIGRGKYGNNYSIFINRDTSAENDYSLKMYNFSLIDNTKVSKIINVFSGSLIQTTRFEMSTLISDVLDQFSTGSVPVKIISLEDNFQKIFSLYQTIVKDNATYMSNHPATKDEKEELEYAQSIEEDSFDPIFGTRLNTRTNELIPYYRNYTEKETGPYVAPDHTVATGSGGTKPTNTSEWSTAKVGKTVVVTADPLHSGLRWLYTVTNVDSDSGEITYDEGHEVEIDDDQYTGINVTRNQGMFFDGGSDGDFQEITVNGIKRAPNASEMKLLLAREQVKAFRGIKDKKILSPARVDLDFIFDANYNMTSDISLTASDEVAEMYSNSTVLTTEDHQVLSILIKKKETLLFTDLNVKAAMYDLNQFRNKNGMTVDPSLGAGGSLFLDCGIIGSKSSSLNFELLTAIDMMKDFTGRATSVDLGYYSIYDPVTRKKIQVTVTYFIAKNLVPHILKEGLNKPFTYSYAQLDAIQSSTVWTKSGDMIIDSFRPSLDLIDWDVKERLYKARINYYVTSEEGRVVKRACQNTRQLDASALLEENNVRVLNTLKKGLDKACQGYLYNWNEPAIRKGFTDTQMAIYRPWIGTLVQDLDIKFDANEWEQERMIMHCYASVKFRDIVKRIILEIGIHRPDYSQGGK